MKATLPIAARPGNVGWGLLLIAGMLAAGCTHCPAALVGGSRTPPFEDVAEPAESSDHAETMMPASEPSWLADQKAGVIREFVGQACTDFGHFYSCENLACLALGIAAAAPLANTSADRDIRDWYQERVRSPGTDDWSAVAKVFGEHYYTIPVYLGCACLGRWFDDTACGSTLHTWANRCMRASLVGAPAVGILQVGLGSGRPEEGRSHWQPFRDSNGVAGHGFIGAVPFLAAASVAENRWLRAALFAGSFATNWSRINDDSHYFSQALLGWWIAYLSVKSVVATDEQARRLQIAPLPMPGGPGIGACFSF